MRDSLAEAVAVVANMVESALAAGVASDAERGAEGHGRASAAAGDDLCAPVEPCAGAVQPGIDRAAVRARGRGGPIGVGSRADRGRRSRSRYLRSRRAAREGFKELVGRMCCGEVGAIFGLEVSRLARSSADLQRLLELSALTDTLIVDADGIYDLHDFNDQLLLGLKGTMSGATRGRTI